MNLEARIWASRLGFEPQEGGKKEEGGFERSAGPEGTDDLC